MPLTSSPLLGVAWVGSAGSTRISFTWTRLQSWRRWGLKRTSLERLAAFHHAFEEDSQTGLEPARELEAAPEDWRSSPVE